MEQRKEDSFWVQCNVCNQQYENWTGSTPCCGSIAYMVEDGKVTDKVSLFAMVGNNIKPVVVNFNSQTSTDGK